MAQFVSRDVEVEWDGKTYTVTPSMSLLRRIEGKGISLMHVAHEVAQGRPQASLMATIIGEVLRSGGAMVSDETIYAELIAGDAKAVMVLYASVIDAISPVSDEKKPVAE